MTRVLIVHNAYKQRGGEDTVVASESELLRSYGVPAALHIVSNDVVTDLSGRIHATLSIRNNQPEIARVLESARDHRADVVHVHNFFPLISPGVHIALANEGFPVVQTLHNYRLLCANGMFLREGRVCEECCEKSSLSAVRHACYRNSRFGSAAVVAMQAASIRNARWRNSVSCFIALTRFQRQKMVAGGLPAERIVVKGNSASDPGPAVGERNGALFVGRLSREKGISTLIEAFAGLPDIPLTIIGDGLQLDQAQSTTGTNIRFVGALDREDVITHMKRAAFLILPSLWYEGFPMSLIEAFSCGLPVIASRIGGIPEIVEDGKTGFLFEPGNVESLRQTVRRAFKTSAPALSKGASEFYRTNHSPSANFAALQDIYARAVDRRIHP